MVSFWISHRGWQSHSKDKCHTPQLRGNSEYSTHDHFCVASHRFHIFSHTITGDRFSCFWSVIRIIEHVCTYIYFIIDMIGGHLVQLYLPPEGTPRLIMEHVCGQSAWSSLKSIPTPKTPAVKNNSELGCSQAEGIDNPFFLLKWALGLKLREQSMYWSFPTQFTYVQDWARVSFN